MKVLKKVQEGRTAAEVCRKYEISTATYLERFNRTYRDEILDLYLFS